MVRRARGPITVDGSLDDPGWRGAAEATGFSETFPEEKGRPPVRTRVLVTYDDHDLFVAFLAADRPSEVRAHLTDRDEMWQDDRVGVLLDTYGEGSWGYEIFANPIGIQGDVRLVTGQGEDDGFDLVFESEGRITDRGYQVEIAIPFSSLRFPKAARQSWRVNFWRMRPRGIRETYSWAAIDRDDPCFLCQFGTLTGLEGIRPGGSLELLPSLTASQVGALEDPSDPSSTFREGGLAADASLSARYSLASGLTAELTVNPDFSQVESDPGQIDANTTFALFFPERRPFFQEGSDLYRTHVDVVYTRAINDPQVAGKLTYRTGSWNLGYIGARDQHSPILLPFEERSFVGEAGASVSNIVRAKRTLGNGSYLGLLATDRRLEGTPGSGSVLGTDGSLRLGGPYELDWQFVASHTREPSDTSLTPGLAGLRFGDGTHTAVFDGESFWGRGEYARLVRDARHWDFEITYEGRSPTLRTDDGFEFRNDYRELTLYQALIIYPRSDIVTQLRPNIYAYHDWDFRGGWRQDFLDASLEGQLTGQTFFDLDVRWNPEHYRGMDFRAQRDWFLYVSSSFSDPVELGVGYGTGRQISRRDDPPVLGDSRSLSVFATLRPTGRLRIEPELDYEQLRRRPDGPEIFSAAVLRTRTSYQLGRSLFVRLVVQYDSFEKTLSVEPLLTYRLNPFSLFYLGAADDYRTFPGSRRGLVSTSRQYFAKMQYLLRL